MAEVRRSTEVGVHLRSKGHTAHWGPLYIPPGRCVGVVTAGALVLWPLLNVTPPPTHTTIPHHVAHPKGTDDPFGAPLLSAGALALSPPLSAPSCTAALQAWDRHPPCGAGGVPMGMWKAFGSRKPLCYVLLLRGGEPWGR